LKFIRCPELWCGAVRPLDATPCPTCRRCAFCRRKAPHKTDRCNCGITDVESHLDRHPEIEVIPYELVKREKLRHELAMHLRYFKAPLYGMVFAGMYIATKELTELSAGFDWWVDVIWTVGIWIVVVFVAAKLLAVLEDCFAWICDRWLLRRMPGAFEEPKETGL
jgi:hypothetical protein